MNKSKKIISIFLVVLMCLSIMPMSDLGIEASAGKTFGAPVKNVPITITCGIDGYDNHNGYDLGVSVGTELYSMFSGTATYYQRYVKSSKKSASYGNYVVVTSDDGVYQAYYCHLSSFNGFALDSSINSCQNYPSSWSSSTCAEIKIGSKHVSAGDSLGKSGSTGNSTGPHCHIGLKVNGSFVDPDKYIDRNVSVTSDGGSTGSSEFTTCIDKAPSDWQTFDLATTSSFNVAGWAFRNNGKHTSVYYCFDNNGYTKLNAVDRPDVVNNLGNSQLDCGFNQNIDISGLSVGNHTFKLWCSSNGVDHEMYYIGITICNSNSTSSPNGIEYSNHSISDITTNDARIKMWISNPTGKTIWTTGFWFGTDPDNLSLYVVHSKINWTDFCSDYQISKYCGELSPGITYYYRFYVVEEENFYYTQSNLYSFTTNGTANVRFDYVETTAKSSLDANISAWAWNDVGYTISSFGFYLGEDPTTMKKYQVYENISWTNFHTLAAVADYAGVLTPGKTYFYRFYAVIDTNYYSDIYSFTTDSALPVYNLTFNANGGSCSVPSTSVTYSTAYGTLPTPTRDGYSFDGWYTAATGETKVTASTTVTAIGNHTLYAHWTCKHNTSEVRNAKDATCTTEGYTGDTYCTTCGTKTKSGSAIAKLSHSYTSAITTPATCEKEGVETITCSECGASYTSALNKNPDNHTGETEIKNAKKATCTENGYTGDTWCKGCSVKLRSGNVIEKVKHSYESIAIENTCTQSGKIINTCINCNDTYEEIIAPTGHTDNDSDGKCDTCNSDTGENKEDDTDSSKNCSCMCHKSGLMGFIWKILRFFYKLFKTNPVCNCGAAHY